MSKITIYEKYGGFDFFHKIIYELYLELFDRIEISHHFIGVDMIRLSRMQAQYLCEAIGGPPMYQGGNIMAVHKDLKVTEYEFDVVAKRFAEIFKSNGLEEDEIKFIMRFIGSKKSVIVTAKNTLIDRIVKYLTKRIKRFMDFFKF